ncbi:MAG: YraN family protein [Patescibacteria group bacterium]|nr:YraN family protein [Patescibacteria group bacterium]
MAKHNEVGRIGEDIASRFLSEKGLKVVERNFRRPYGEIDIVSRESSGIYRFVEVKTVSWETGELGVSHETGYRPEENMHPQKVKRLMRVIESYILFRSIEEDWQVDVIAVYLDREAKRAKVRHLENVVLGS